MRRKLHDFTRRQQLTRRLLAGDHQVAEPRRQAMACIVGHRSHLRCGAQRVANPARGSFVVCRERHPHVAVVEERVIGPVCPLNLVQTLGYQEGLDAVSGHEGQRRLKEIQPPQGRELVKHQ